MRKKAFTLIELLVVIAIIGILAAMILVNLGSVRSKARDVRRRTDLYTISLAAQMYLDDHGYYPYPTSGGDGTIYSNSGEWDGNLKPQLQNYLEGGVLPKDQLNNTVYFYQYQSCQNLLVNGTYCGGQKPFVKITARFEQTPKEGVTIEGGAPYLIKYLFW